MSSTSRKQRRSSSSNSNDNKDGDGGRRSGRGPAPFLMKTHQMVEDEAGDEVISWGENGTSFVVWKPVEFARDLLPLHFKHNNFSSFVRQLNTYGFRKVVPERWEFANDNFRRGEPGRLCDIRRRKAPPNPSSANKSSTAKNIVAPTSTSTSLDSSTSSPPPPPLPPPPSQQFLDLSNENEKLKKDNQILSKELEQAKQQCEHLLRLLSEYVNSNDINAGLLMKEAARVGMEVEREETKKKMEGAVEAAKEAKEEGNNVACLKETKKKMEGAVEAAKEAKEEGNNVACLKLFGVLLSGTNGGRKRGRCEEGGGGGGRPVKVCFGRGSPWMGMSSPVGESSKVCN